MAARTRSASPVLIPPSVPPLRPDTPPYAAVLGDDLVVGERAASAGQLEPVADLDALDRLDPHQRGREPGVQTPVPVHVAAEARGQAVHDDLDDAAEGVALGTRSRRPRPTIAALAPGSRQRTGSASMAGRSPTAGTRPVGRDRGAEGDDVGQHLGPDCLRAGTPCATAPRATRAAVSRALARSSTGRASSKPYFCIPTRSAWPGRGRVSGALRASPSSCSAATGSGDITTSQLGHSLLPIRMATGPPCVTAVAYAAEDLQLVALELLPRAAAGAEPAAGQVDAEVLACHLDPGRQSLEGREQRRAVRLPRRKPPQHGHDPSDPQRGPGPGSLIKE